MLYRGNSIALGTVYSSLLVYLKNEQITLKLLLLDYFSIKVLTVTLHYEPKNLTLLGHERYNFINSNELLDFMLRGLRLAMFVFFKNTPTGSVINRQKTKILDNKSVLVKIRHTELKSLLTHSIQLLK